MMKYYIVIDCGTTNSRAYVVDKAGNVLGVSKKTVGVKDVSTTGDKQILVSGLKEIVGKAVKNAGIKETEVIALLSSGMITSEIGLMEIPHATAPCNISELSQSITCVDNCELLPGKKLYLIRGIKNPVLKAKSELEQVGLLDFMRGEETQVAGILAKNKIKLPSVVVVLSSHTKFIPITKNGNISGSLTTLSGQLYDITKNNTFLTKSLVDNGIDKKPDNYFDADIVDIAFEWDKEVGLNRSLMFPRFLDVLLDSAWYERELFLEALIACEDMKTIGQLEAVCEEKPLSFCLIGKPGRCSLYEYLIGKILGNVDVFSITDENEIDQLAIDGALNVAYLANLQ